MFFLDLFVVEFFLFFFFEFFSGRFDTSGSMIPFLVPEIEGGYPQHHGGEGEEGQGWRNSIRG